MEHSCKTDKINVESRKFDKRFDTIFLDIIVIVFNGVYLCGATKLMLWVLELLEMVCTDDLKGA